MAATHTTPYQYTVTIIPTGDKLPPTATQLADAVLDAFKMETKTQRVLSPMPVEVPNFVPTIHGYDKHLEKKLVAEIETLLKESRQTFQHACVKLAQLAANSSSNYIQTTLNQISENAYHAGLSFNTQCHVIGEMRQKLEAEPMLATPETKYPVQPSDYKQDVKETAMIMLLRAGSLVALSDKIPEEDIDICTKIREHLCTIDAIVKIAARKKELGFLSVTIVHAETSNGISRAFFDATGKKYATYKEIQAAVEAILPATMLEV